MLAISALKLLWCIDDALESGIFLFFLKSHSHIQHQDIR